MKTRTIFLLAIGFLTITCCTPKPDVNKILENQETKNELFNAIIENHDHMTEFMETMQNDKHALQMRKENKMIMHKMMEGQGMQMMMNDSTIIKSMMNNQMMKQRMMQEMMSDSTQMKGIMHKMHQEGMMCDGCMKMMMNKGKVDSKK
jgi:hypothetical protein